MQNNRIEIPTNLKKSLTISMKVQIHRFLSKHNGCIEIYQTEEDLIDSLFFYWFLNSSRKKYKWIEQKNIYNFLNKYSQVLKNRLKILFNEMK